MAELKRVVQTKKTQSGLEIQYDCTIAYKNQDGQDETAYKLDGAVVYVEIAR